MSSPKRRQVSQVTNIGTTVVNAIKEHTEKGQRLCEIFLELPSKIDYPDYYKIITEPISLKEIQIKLDKQEYHTLLEFQQDFELMINNATTYNRKGSWVYKNALSLKTLFDGLMETGVDFDELKSILKRLYQLKDEQGNLVSELFQELPSAEEYPDYYEEIKQPIALDSIKKKVQQKQYRSKQEFIDDLNLMFANAKQYNAEGSFVYQNSVLLQELAASLLKIDGNLELVDFVTVNDQRIQVGDYVYCKNDQYDKPIIVQVESAWKQKDSDKQGITGCWYLRPEQTAYKAGHRFMENEVFKTNHLVQYSVEAILHKCIVLFIKDYIRGRPKDFDMKDVYVCESRYNEQAKQYSKIKVWATCLPEKARHREVDLVLYDSPITPNRISPEVKEEEGIQTRKRKQSQTDFEKTLPIPQRPVYPAGVTQVKWGGIHAPNPNVQIVPPLKAPGIEPLPSSTISYFDTTADKKLKWFPAPPIDAISPKEPTMHSIEYLMFKQNLPKRQQTLLNHVTKKVKSNEPNEVLEESFKDDQYWEPVREVLADLADIWLSNAKGFVACQ